MTVANADAARVQQMIDLFDQDRRNPWAKSVLHLRPSFITRRRTAYRCRHLDVFHALRENLSSALTCKDWCEMGLPRRAG
jgi:hypothetical protein